MKEVETTTSTYIHRHRNRPLLRQKTFPEVRVTKKGKSFSWLRTTHVIVLIYMYQHCLKSTYIIKTQKTQNYTRRRQDKKTKKGEIKRQ